jgi:hypothetical protein
MAFCRYLVFSGLSDMLGNCSLCFTTKTCIVCCGRSGKQHLQSFPFSCYSIQHNDWKDVFFVKFTCCVLFCFFLEDDVLIKTMKLTWCGTWFSAHSGMYKDGSTRNRLKGC